MCVIFQDVFLGNILKINSMFQYSKRVYELICPQFFEIP